MTANCFILNPTAKSFCRFPVIDNDQMKINCNILFFIRFPLHLLLTRQRCLWTKVFHIWILHIHWKSGYNQAYLNFCSNWFAVTLTVLINGNEEILAGYIVSRGVCWSLHCTCDPPNVGNTASSWAKQATDHCKRLRWIFNGFVPRAPKPIMITLEDARYKSGFMIGWQTTANIISFEYHHIVGALLQGQMSDMFCS